MKINSVIMKGFKNALEERVFTFDDMTIFEGENGTGKTTIGEAIVWCFLGCDLFGSERDSALLNPEAKATEVTVDFEHNGEQHSFTRRKKKSKLELYLDDESAKQEDVTQFVYDKKVFLSIFNPMYVTQLAPREAKEFFTSILDSISKEKVYEAMDSWIVEKLKEANFRNPSIFLEDKRKELKELEEDKIYNEGVLGTLKLNEEIPDKISFDSAKLEELESKYEELLNTNFSIPYDIDNEKEKKLKLEAEICAIEARPVEGLFSTSEIEKQIDKVNWSIESPPFDKPRKCDISSLLYTRTERLKEYDQLREEKSQIKKQIVECSECGNKMDIGAYTLEYINKRIAEVKANGLQIKAKIEEAQAKEEQERKTYEELLKVHKKECEAELTKLQKEMEKIFTANNKIREKHQIAIEKEVSKIQNKIDKLNIAEKIRANQEADEKHRLETKDKIAEVKSEIRNIKNVQLEVAEHNAMVDSLIRNKESNQKEYEETVANTEMLEGKITDIKTLITCAKEYNQTKLNLQTQSINQHLDKVTLKLFEISKSTGELKDTFEINYDGKDFKIISMSESIKAGLEISSLVMNTIGIELPIFVDNAESITSYELPRTQVIEVRVKADSPLRRVN